jgi:hypothetical protein
MRYWQKLRKLDMKHYQTGNIFIYVFHENLANIVKKLSVLASNLPKLMLMMWNRKNHGIVSMPKYVTFKEQLHIAEIHLIA